MTKGQTSHWSPRRRGKGCEAAKIFEETIAGIPTICRRHKPTHLGSSTNLKQYKDREILPRHIIPKLLNAEDKEKVLKTTKEKFDTLPPGEQRAERKKKCNVFKVLKELSTRTSIPSENILQK